MQACVTAQDDRIIILLFSSLSCSMFGQQDDYRMIIWSLKHIFSIFCNFSTFFVIFWILACHFSRQSAFFQKKRPLRACGHTKKGSFSAKTTFLGKKRPLRACGHTEKGSFSTKSAFFQKKRPLRACGWTEKVFFFQKKKPAGMRTDKKHIFQKYVIFFRFSSCIFLIFPVIRAPNRMIFPTLWRKPGKIYKMCFYKIKHIGSSANTRREPPCNIGSMCSPWPSIALS